MKTWEQDAYPSLYRGFRFVGEGLEEQGYAHVSEVPVKEIWAKLKSDPQAVLIDVRTMAEWSFVGVPDLSALERQVLLMEWQTFPDGRFDPDFTGRLDAALSAAGTGKNDALYFICRSGGRSRKAAEAMAGAGYRHCANVTEGFEGPLDHSRHRGAVSGWKVAGLPWIQG